MAGTKNPPLRPPGHRFFPAISDSAKIQIMPKKRKKSLQLPPGMA
jgi:hypothetical protein